MGFGYYAVRFDGGITDVAVCQLYTHPKSGPLEGQVLRQNGPSVGDVDPVECARLLQEYGIQETRIRLKLLIVKQVISNGQPTCDLVWPTNFGQEVSEFVDLTVVGQTQNDTITRLRQGWLQPLVSIKPVDTVFNPSRSLQLSCSDPYIPASSNNPKPPTLSYVWSILEQESHLAPLLGSTVLGSDPCTLQLPPHSLQPGARYVFQLEAFLPSGKLIHM